MAQGGRVRGVLRFAVEAVWRVPYFVIPLAIALDVRVLHLWLPMASLGVAALAVAGVPSRWRRGERGRVIGMCLLLPLAALCAMIAEVEAGHEERRAAAEVLAAARRYQADTGRAPASLEALVPAYVARLPEIRTGWVGRIEYTRRSDAAWCIRWGGFPDWVEIHCEPDLVEGVRARPSGSARP